MQRGGDALLEAGDALSEAMRAKPVRVFFVTALLLTVAFVGVHFDHTAAVYAQTGGSLDGAGQNLDKSFRSMVELLYNKLRIPVSILGLIIAVLCYMSSSVRGTSTAIRIGVAVFLWAFVPTIYNLITGIAGGNGLGGATGW